LVTLPCFLWSHGQVTRPSVIALCAMTWREEIRMEREDRKSEAGVQQTRPGRGGEQDDGWRRREQRRGKSG
jgi:hypothetical protein